MQNAKSMVGWYGRVEYASTLVPGRMIRFRGVVAKDEGELLWLTEVKSGALNHAKLLPARRASFTHLKPPAWLSAEQVDRARRQVARAERRS